MSDTAARGDDDPRDRATGSDADRGSAGRVEPDGRARTGGSRATATATATATVARGVR